MLGQAVLTREECRERVAVGEELQLEALVPHSVGEDPEVELAAAQQSDLLQRRKVCHTRVHVG